MNQLKKLITCALAAAVMVGAMPTLYAGNQAANPFSGQAFNGMNDMNNNQQPANGQQQPDQPQSGFDFTQATLKPYINVFTLGVLALGYIAYRSNVWERINKNPRASKYDAFKQGIREDLGDFFGWFKSFPQTMRTWKNKLFGFFGINDNHNADDAWDVGAQANQGSARNETDASSTWEAAKAAGIPESELMSQL